MKRQPILLALGLLRLGAALVVYMGWLGSAGITNRRFDQWGFFAAGVILLWRSLGEYRKPTG